jgi:acyl-CoA synthetase (AMP-forming)/AMP-acid ligase II
LKEVIPSNVGPLFAKAARTFPERLAIAYGDYELNYRQANALRGLEITKGAKVAILLHNCPEFLEMLFTCFKAGLGAVPINFRPHPRECSFIIDNSESEAVLLGDNFRNSLYAFKKEMPRVKHYFCISDPLDGMTAYESLLRGQSAQFTDEEVARDDLAWIFYPSGTTGRPKGAMLTHHVLMTMNFFGGGHAPHITPLGGTL